MLTVRGATLADYAHYARWITELGVDDPPPDRDRWCEHYMPTTVIAELSHAQQGVQPAGYAMYTLNDGDVYVRNVVTDPAFRRRGVGRGLLAWIAQTARDGGATTWRLNVKPDNRPAIALYESFGMSWAYASAALRLDLEVCTKLRDSRATERVQSSQAWADLESRHDLARGTIAGRAARGDIVLVTQASQSLAVFDPGVPGAFIFKPNDFADAEALLRAMLRHCSTAPSAIQVVVEDDEAMITRLLDRGAYIQMRFVHYAGVLPGPT